MTITAAYCPPRFSIPQQEFENFFSSLGPRFIVGADWNAKHTICSSRLITTRGRNLYQATRSNRYSYLSTGEPTYWPTDREKMPDLLEFFVVQGVSNNYTTVESNYDIFYDRSLSGHFNAINHNNLSTQEYFAYIIKNQLGRVPAVPGWESWFENYIKVSRWHQWSRGQYNKTNSAVCPICHT